MTKEKSVGVECVSGISFQDRTFSRQKLFALDCQKNALDYCYQQYLADRGSICYLIVEEDEGFAVCREDKTLRIIGIKDPVEILSSQDLNDLSPKLLALSRIENSDPKGYRSAYRQYDRDSSQDFAVGKTWNDITTFLTDSLQKAIDLSQQITDRQWLNCPVDRNSSVNIYSSARLKGN